MNENAGLRKTRRCAIYTRKSSEEGLEQGFNSLDAQREACAAYIISQKAEGWKALPTLYDDGGFSGGSMERPALKRLMDDIAVGRIDVVVVYKIDRLTRSLADFARMVELFESRAVSFVSVTQAFSTTTSMGRLTLNVLLSFAQFEREVTGERIRDKIAASKKKGMWMGGIVPLGFDRPQENTRALIVNEPEAELVRTLFTRYLELGSVHALERELKAQDIRTKVTVQSNGSLRGGCHFSRGSLFHLLRNRLYLGEITHKGQSYPGQHEAIVAQELFDTVQLRLNAQSRRFLSSQQKGICSSPLTGRIEDADGHPMSPAFTYGRHKKLYRYYISAFLQQGGKRAAHDPHPRRVPAQLIENELVKALHEHVTRGEPLDAIDLVVVRADRLVVTLKPAFCGARSQSAQLIVPFQLANKSGRTEIIRPDHPGPRYDPVLIKALRQAHARLEKDPSGGPLLDVAPAALRARRIVRLAFLAPDLQRALLEGRQPRRLTLARLLEGEIPLAWSDQKRLFESLS